MCVCEREREHVHVCVFLCVCVYIHVCVCKKKKGRNHTWEIKGRKKYAGAGGFSETLDAMCRVAEVTWCTFSVAVTLLSSSGERGGLHKLGVKMSAIIRQMHSAWLASTRPKQREIRHPDESPPLTATLQASYSPRRASPPGFYCLFIETCTMLSCLNFVSLRLFTLLFV